jgi:hypothetical protein
MDEWQWKTKYSGKTRTSAAMSTTEAIWLDTGSNPGSRGRKAETNAWATPELRTARVYM